MVVDPAFEGAGKQDGLSVWRVENLGLAPVDPRHHGTFYSGDSYILLKTIANRAGNFEWSIHFWLGTHTSQDEAGIAAIKTIELDDYLGGSPVQYREVQDHESKLFFSYFKNGIRYLDGGVASGFRHVEEDNTHRMMIVKGRRNVRVRQVPVSVKSMNHGDCFILDTGSEVFVWIGNKSGRMERLRAVMAASSIRDEMHGGRSSIVIIDSDSGSAEESRFFEKVGDGTIADVTSAALDTEEEDLAFERDAPIALYKIWSEGENINEEIVATSDLTRELLESDNCHLLDAGLYGIFVWVGRHADNLERAHAMAMAQIYITKKALPKWVTVTRVVEFAEPMVFKQFFKTWTTPENYQQLKRFANARPEEIEIPENPTKSRALVKNLGSACGFVPDDGTGEIDLWRIQNFELGHVDDFSYGIFFGGECYVLKYRTVGGKYLIYFWMGKESSMDDRAAAVLWSSNIDASVGGKSIQIRVNQGAEPEHFCRIFKGKMVIMMGGKGNGFRTPSVRAPADANCSRLFQVRGTSSYNTRAQQVPAVASSLNSDDVFVLETVSQNYIWIGKESSEEEKNLAHSIVPRLAPGRGTDEVEEGSESDQFWDALGGKAEYPHGRPELVRPQLDPRLFKVSEKFGRLRLEEIVNYEMEDLCEDDVMLLDSGDEIYIWVGNLSSETEKEGALKYAEQFLNTDRTGRSTENTTILILKQGMEPDSFATLFPSWDPETLQG